MYPTRGVPAGGDFDVHPRVLHARGLGLESARADDVHGINGATRLILGGAGAWTRLGIGRCTC